MCVPLSSSVFLLQPVFHPPVQTFPAVVIIIADVVAVVIVKGKMITKMSSIHSPDSYSAVKQRRADTFHPVDEPRNVTLSERATHRRSPTVEDSISRKCPEQANPERQKADECLPGAVGRGTGSVC